MGELVRLMVDLFNEVEIVDILVYVKGCKLLIVLSEGDGFVVNEDDVIVQICIGKQVLNVKGDIRIQVVKFVDGDYVVVVGENCKVLIFLLFELFEMGCGKGVCLQKYKDGGLLDVCIFMFVDGLLWFDFVGCIRIEIEFVEWLGKCVGMG